MKKKFLRSWKSGERIHPQVSQNINERHNESDVSRPSPSQESLTSSPGPGEMETCSCDMTQKSTGCCVLVHIHEKMGKQKGLHLKVREKVLYMLRLSSYRNVSQRDYVILSGHSVWLWAIPYFIFLVNNFALGTFLLPR